MNTNYDILFTLLPPFCACPCGCFTTLLEDEEEGESVEDLVVFLFFFVGEDIFDFFFMIALLLGFLDGLFVLWIDVYMRFFIQKSSGCCG